MCWHGSLTGAEKPRVEKQNYSNNIKAWGKTASQAIERQNEKREILYEFRDSSSVIGATYAAIPRVKIIAAYDQDDEDDRDEFYEVNWDDVVSPLMYAMRHGEIYFFSFSKDKANATENRELFAVLNTDVPNSINRDLHTWMHKK